MKIKRKSAEKKEAIRWLRLFASLAGNLHDALTEVVSAHDDLATHHYLDGCGLTKEHLAQHQAVAIFLADVARGAEQRVKSAN
jgi:hypothetical protein